MTDRVAAIREKLESEFNPSQLEIIDESHLHVGHAGAKEGKGHFRVQIVSEQFAAKSPIQRHKMIFQTLADLMESDIHALSIKASPPKKEE